MKLLCLHGIGQSGEVFKAATAKLRSQLPKDWSYHFIDGSVESEPAPGVAESFPGPYFCFGQTYDTVCIAEQHDYIKSLVEEDGPFDGLLAFSQGAAIAASLILHQQLENPFDPPVFRFAVFIAGTLPFTKAADIGEDVSEHYAQCSADASLRGMRENPDDWVVHDTTLDPSRMCRQFYPNSSLGQIEIPTVHIYDGDEKAQYLREQHPALRDLCRPDGRATFYHKSGHRIPTTMDENKAIADLVLKAAELSEIQL